MAQRTNRGDMEGRASNPPQQLGLVRTGSSVVEMLKLPKDAIVARNSLASTLRDAGRATNRLWLALSLDVVKGTVCKRGD